MLIITKIKDKGYVFDGQCFKDYEAIISYTEKKYPLGCQFRIKQADERTEAYWLEHWNAE